MYAFEKKYNKSTSTLSIQASMKNDCKKNSKSLQLRKEIPEILAGQYKNSIRSKLILGDITTKKKSLSFV